MEVTVQSSLSNAPGSLTIPVSPDQTVDSIISAFCTEKGIRHNKKFVLRNCNQLELPNVVTLASCDVQHGDTFYLGLGASRGAYSNPCHLWLLALVAFIVGGVGIAAIVTVKVRADDPLFDYGVVVDAGSSHSQVVLYKWDGAKENGTAVAKQSHTCRVDGGISSDVSSPAEAGRRLIPCLDETVAHIPLHMLKDTPVYLGATAGMRLLEQSDNVSCQAILASVRKTLSNYTWQFTDPDSHARILTGAEEGSFSWITSNYVSGVFVQLRYISSWLYHMVISDPPVTLGALDMGGASTQISFIPEKPADIKPGYKERMVLYGRPYDVYTHSYLCYGLNEAYRKLIANLVMDQNNTGQIQNPCGPEGNITYMRGRDIFEVPCTDQKSNLSPDGANSNTNYTILGTSNATQCREVAEALFNFTCTEHGSNCGFDGVYQPPVHGKFLAFNGFYYTMNFLNVSKVGTTLQQVRDATNQFCALSYNEIKHMSTSPDLIRYCFYSHYMDLMLTSGYKFTDTNWNNLLFVKKVHETDLGWPLGFMLNTSNTIPELVPAVTMALPVFVCLLLLFNIFLITAVGLAFSAWRGRRRALHYERLNTYGSTL